MNMQTIKKISCKRCQRRKIRCSRTDPCVSCTMAKAACEFRGDDSKRPPVSREYVTTLESRIAHLEMFMSRVKSAAGDERDRIIAEISNGDHLFPAGSLNISAAMQNKLEETRKASFQENENGSLVYHGPTSIFTTNPPESNRAMYSGPSLPQTLVINLSPSGPVFSECIALFFHWQYSQFMFIPREQFLLDYQNSSGAGQFCSPALIYAICSIGACMSSNPSTKQNAESFSAAAHSLLFPQGLGTPHLTSVQALLCCAFYELSKGDFSRAWLFSGMAFRMGQDLGFQRDPKHWQENSSLASPPQSHEYLRRLYWGCYISDKLFSLFLGRPTTLDEHDADVDPSEPLPQYPLVNKWFEEENLSHLQETIPVVPRLTLVFNQLVALGRTIQELLSRMFASRNNESQQWTEISLNEMNAKLESWYERLPKDMRWKSWAPSSDLVKPNVSVLHVLYHSARISLNRPFLNLKPTTPSSAGEGMYKVSYDICRSSKDAMTSIFQRFKQQHGLKHSPIVFVLGALVAINVTITLSKDHNPGTPVIVDPDFLLLDSTLEEMSETWKLAADMRKKIRFGSSSRAAFQNESSSGERSTQRYKQHSDYSIPIPRSTNDSNTMYASYDESMDIEGEALVNSDPYFWDPLGIPESVLTEWLNF